MGNLIIPDTVFEQLKISPAELRLEIAVYLWHSKRLDFNQACEFAGIQPELFRKILLTKSHILLNPETSKDNHFLHEILGAMDDVTGDELESVTSNEFQAIEGEW